ncbi:acyloxyacyl hydrolase-like isoform X2 [Lycorma delicatula]
MHLAEINNKTVLDASFYFCKHLPMVIQKPCYKIVRNIEPLLISEELHSIITPDVLCYGIHFCQVDDGANYCHLFPKPFSNFHEAVQLVRVHVARIGGYQNVESFDICSLPFIKDLCNDFYDWFEDMKPAIDYDKDNFSAFQVGRGSYWRGRDCSDFAEDVYPGRLILDSDKIVDSDCNGIYGYSPSNEPWEDVLCNGSEARGLIVVGDSVGAHFHMPEAWFDAALFSWNALVNISDPLCDELDWPQLGFSTGFMNTTSPELIQGKTDSVYLRLRERNRCNHRDYQNLCRNGELSFDHVNTSEKIARDPKRDKPVLLLYEELGNDVCNNSPDTLANMTTPEQFRFNVMQFLTKVDKRLPKNSHVVLVGLVDGSRIYLDLAEKYHPIGRLHKDVKYKDVYQWFLCMQIGPCNGWMNPDESIRITTSARAKELSAVLKDIANKAKDMQMFSSFKVHYMDNPFEDVVKKWESQGGKAWQLYEPVDSFHPNQLAQPLIADVVWNKLLELFPDAVGPINPHNDIIENVFGSQGGH